jgi:hypothetical protein
MKGNNTLLLNEATMIEAVQEYMTKRMGSTYVPKVNSVKPAPDKSYSGVQVFEVLVTKDAPTEASSAEAK